MLQRLLIVLFAAWAGVATMAPADAAGVVFPLGSRVGLEPAGDLTLSTQFPGFVDAQRHVAVSILDLPAAAYDELTRSAFAANQRGLTNIKREGFLFTGGMGFLVTADAEVNGSTVHRWFMAASPAAISVPNQAMLIRVEVPDAARDVYTDAVVRKMLASVTLRQVPVEELLGLLPFKVGDLAGFRVSKIVPNGVIVTDGPTDDVTHQAYAIITARPGGPTEPDDRARFARDLLADAPVKELRITSGDQIRIGGQPAMEIRADALNPSGEKISLVQWIRFAPNGFIRIIGVAPKDKWDAVFNRFRALRDGLTPR